MKLYSDDYGLNHQIDKEILKLVRKGKIMGLSVIANMARPVRLRQLAKTLEDKRNILVGLHINLIQGKPSEHFLSVRTLVNSDGIFHPLLIFLAKLFSGQIQRTELKKEIVSQLEYLKSKKIKLNLLDSHQHTHAFSPVSEVVAEVAEDYGIKKIRSFNTIKTHSPKGRIIYFFLKLLAFFSYFLSYRRFGMPHSWRRDRDLDWTVMSWESDTFEVKSVDRQDLAFVIHPFLPYDSNKSYRSYIK